MGDGGHLRGRVLRPWQPRDHQRRRSCPFRVARGQVLPHPAVRRRASGRPERHCHHRRGRRAGDLLAALLRLTRSRPGVPDEPGWRDLETVARGPRLLAAVYRSDLRRWLRDQGCLGGLGGRERVEARLRPDLPQGELGGHARTQQCHVMLRSALPRRGPQPRRRGDSVHDYPKMITPADHVEPVPRRIRAMLGGEVVLDTTGALYVWEWPNYPQYYIPVTDVKPAVLVDEQHPQKLRRGTARRHGLRAGGLSRPGCARVYGDDALAGLAGTVRFDWDALDAWFEEDEEVFVHPRSPYTRVDALRSTRTVRIELDGVTLAESSSPVMVFETGLPTRYYLNRTEVNFAHLQPTSTVTACPYRGKTSGYWSVRAGETVHPDLAWAYDFPTRQLLPIAGMVAFYNEKVDITIDGRQLERPVTHFFR